MVSWMIEVWVPDDCWSLKPPLFGVFFHSQPNPTLSKGPILVPNLTPENLGFSCQVYDVTGFIIALGSKTHPWGYSSSLSFLHLQAVKGGAWYTANFQEMFVGATVIQETEEDVVPILRTGDFNQSVNTS